jgi:MoaA/NifB/PqqE/SkfB family radical SAM enzyme
MINIFINYTCQLRCPYCFALDMQSIYPKPVSTADFARLMSWVVGTGVPSVAFLGGEPTLHPDLEDMVCGMSDAGVAVVLFTNGLAQTDLMQRLAGRVKNFVINYNVASLYTGEQIERLHANLALLHSMGKNLTFSKNFSPAQKEYEYLLDGAGRYGVSAIRCDLARPSMSGKNAHVPVDGMRSLTSTVVEFVSRCKERGIGVGLDCCMRMCDLETDEKIFLKRETTKFIGICHPSIDVHPDLSASYCLPMQHVRIPDITAFSGEEAVRWHLAEMMQPVRAQSAGEACLSCEDFRRHCQGGCLARRGEYAD